MSSSIPLLVLWVAFGLGCAAEPPPVALYPNSAAHPRSPAEVAVVEGPIEKIDGQNVNGQGTRFALLPGCHVVDIGQANEGYSMSSGAAVTGQVQPATYALRMKPGARYTIRRETLTSELQTFRVVLTATEELPGGATTNLDPIKSGEEIAACKSWETTLGH
jgi:hypothetical protein